MQRGTAISMWSPPWAWLNSPTKIARLNASMVSSVVALPSPENG